MHLLIKQEDEIRRRTMEFLHVQEIPYIDLLPVLRDCFKAGRQPYLWIATVISIPPDKQQLPRPFIST